MASDPDKLKAALRSRGWVEINAHSEIGPDTYDHAEIELKSLGFEHHVLVPVTMALDVTKVILEHERQWKDWTTRGVADRKNDLVTRHTIFAFSDLHDAVFFQLLR